MSSILAADTYDSYMKLYDGLMCLSIEWKLFTSRNSNREQLRKIHQDPEDLIVDEFFSTVPG